MKSRSGKSVLGIAAITILFVLSLAVMIYSEEEKSIGISLTYGDNPGFDDNNDGAETPDSAVDFSVSQTEFSWEVNESNLCTLWSVLPIEDDTAVVTCYGAAHCCNFIDLSPALDAWDETFYLFNGSYGVRSSALVSAKVVYVDYNIEELLAEILYSDWDTLTAEFGQGGIAFSQSGIEVTSPTNSSPLSSGEGVMLTVSAEADSVLYSLDGSQNTTMQWNSTAGSYFSLLDGSLAGGVLSNGSHMIKIYAVSETTESLEHPFSVSDIFPPEISLFPAINNTNINSTGSYQITVNSNELVSLYYILNSGSPILIDALTHSGKINITPIAGPNTLIIIASDMQGNSRSYFHTFNFTLESQGSCVDSVQNYHHGLYESGIDCGGPCPACVEFIVATDKQTYSQGELVYISVQARQDAIHNITVTGPNYRTSFAYNGSTYYVIAPANAGQYAINVSLKYRELPPDYVLKQFSITSTSTLTVSISANATSITKGDFVGFSALVSGNRSAVSYKWSLNNDSTVDSTSREVNYTYSSQGTYPVTLNVTDGFENKSASVTITVKPFYNITVNVTDSAGNSISSAIVSIGGSIKAAVPLAQYTLPARSQSIQINASGYLNKSYTIDVDKNETYNYVLYKYDVKLPYISLVSPEKNANLSPQAVTLKFLLEDDTTNNCTLYLNQDNSWWLRHSSIVVNTGEHSFTLDNPENTTYLWKVGCVDEAQNSNVSEERVFTIFPDITGSVDNSNITQRVDYLIGEIDEIILAVSSYGKLESEAADSLKLSEYLEKSKTELQWAMRDINNVKWRRLNLTDEQSFIDETLNKIAIIEGNITKDLKVIKSSKFVSYPESADVQEAAEAYLSSLLSNPTKQEINSYAAASEELQEGAVITTDYKVVEVTTYTGAKKIITLIEKSMDYNGDMSELVLIEFIPKEVASSVSSLKPLFTYEVVEEDPIITVELPEDKKFSYYIEREFSQEQVQKTSSILLSKSLNRESKSPTGFTIFGFDEGLSSPKARIVIEVIAAVILLVIYLGYTRGLFRFHKESKELKKLKAMVEEIRGFTQQNNYEKAKETYAGIRSAFKQLKPDERKLVYSTLGTLHYELDAKYVKKRIDEANDLLSNGQKEHASAVYAELTRVYKALPAEYKKSVYNDCAELHKKIAGGK
ncbi:PKD domain-containing protein [Candidatus Woesearchaeota archaeon]|nr:PKD domain-containing protein [Candidatus Woesearchaeota archaeon]